MAILTSPDSQILESKESIFARKGNRIAVRVYDDYHSEAMCDLGLDPDNDLPDDAGVVGRSGKSLTWLGESTQYKEFGVPKPGERENTVIIARQSFPNFKSRGL